MKRQKLKVFNSCHHIGTMNCVSENKLFTVLFNRRAMLAIALLLSTLLPLNHAAPTAKSSYSNGIQTETTSIPSSPSMPTTTQASIAVKLPSILNATFQTDKINDKLVSPPIANTPSNSIEKMLSNDKASTIEYNNNVATIKSDLVRVVTTQTSVSSSNNYLDKNNHSVLPINILISDIQTSTIHNTIDKKINADSTANDASTLPPTIELFTVQNENFVTTTTFMPHQYSNSPIGLSDVRQESNKNPTQETIFTTLNTVQTVKSSTILPESMTTDISKSSSDNTGTSTSKTSSLTEIDEHTLNVNANEHFNGLTNMQSEASNPLSTLASIQTNDNDSATVDENSKPFDGELGHSESKYTEILFKSASTVIPSASNNHGGKIVKVFDEEKWSNIKAKHESMANNNKKYNNKNNKDKSKNKANDDEEEGGVNDPNGKLNDNLLMESVSFTQDPPPSSSSPSVLTDESSVQTTIRSVESQFDSSNDKNNEQTFDEIRTDSVINPDVTNFTPTSISPTTLNGLDSVTQTTTSEFSTKTEFESIVQKYETLGQKVESTSFIPETKESMGEITFSTKKAEMQLSTEKAATEVTENNDSNKHFSTSNGNEMNKSDNELMRTSSTNAEATSTTIAPKPAERPSILDYDKSSEEIFDIVRDTSTTKPDITSTMPEKRLHNDEFFLPADDLDTDPNVKTQSTVTTSATTTTIQSTIPINTESAIVRPNTDGLGPTITIPIPIVTSNSKQQQSTDLNKASTISRDSDTIFYISNTEVKVVESSVPTPNSKQENQFFPALFEEDVIIDFPGKNSTGWNTGLDGVADKYEEDIILSPMKSNFDPTKLNDENLSISYVGESFIDIKEATSDDTSAGSDLNVQNNDISSESREIARSFGDNSISSNVIIEPVVIPDLQQSIGVPIIGELPSQINIRDLDYKNDVAVQLNNSGNSISSHFPTHPGDNLQKAQELTAELPKTDSEEVTALIEDDKIDIGKNETQPKSSNTTAEAITNVTAFSILDDDPDTNWNDIQTIIIIALLTVVPTIGCLILIFAIRKVYRKAISLRDGNSNGTNGNVLLRDSSTDPLAMNPHTITSDELKSADCEANGINHSNDNLISSAEITSIHCDEIANGGGGGGGLGQMNHHSGANGSLITMTMKNNHLIVETEERNDIGRDVRETKVHYSPSEKDGVFVVEVARGADSNTTPIMSVTSNGALAAAKSMTVEQMSVSPRQIQATIVEMPEDQPKCVDYASSNDCNVSCTRSNEKVLVHPPPNGMCLEEDVLMIDEDGTVSMSSPKHNASDEIETGAVASGGQINTGLSQSDLSISSSDGSNRAYCYGLQESYTVESKCYQSTSPVRNIASIDTSIPTPEPITVISDTEHENQINENGTLENALDDTLMMAKPISIEIINENQIQTTDNGIILSKALKATVEIENGNNPEPDHDHNHIQQNGFKTETIITTNGNTKLNGDHANGLNGNDHLTDDSNDFDSLMNFPAPPTCDEIKQFNDITQLDNGNMDSLPPPPPEILPAAAAGPINVES